MLEGIYTPKVLVIYDTKYGNTKIAAEQIAEGLNEKRIETSTSYVKEIDPTKIKDYDALVIGAPNHMGRPSQTIKKFVNKLEEQDLKEKNVAVFGTYSGKMRADRSVKKLEEMLKQKCSTIKLIVPGLSVKVKGVTGPLTEGEVLRAKEFGKKIADLIV